MKTHDWSELISEHFETKLCWVMTMYPGLLNVIVKMIPLNDKYHFGSERIVQNSLRPLEIRNVDKPIGTNSRIFVTKTGFSAIANNIINLNNHLLCDVQADKIKTNASSDMVKE